VRKTVEKMLLAEHLKKLKLPTMLREYEECSRQAKEIGSSYEAFLLSLSTREIEHRHARRIERYIGEARFPNQKTLENADLSRWPSLDRMKIQELATARFVEQKENVIILGRHGTGKTHLSIALAIEAARKGFRVSFTTTASIANTLIEAREERTLKRAIARYVRPHLLVVDEMGYIPLSKEGAQLVFQVFSERYERGSMIVTSNLSFNQWTTIFDDVNLTAALLDRLTHHSHVLQFDWESLRLSDSLKRARASQAQNRPVAATGPSSREEKKGDKRKETTPHTP
jgi:DNA replication protein DnaC